MNNLLALLVVITATAAPFEVLQWDVYPIPGATFRLYSNTNSPARAGTFTYVGDATTATVGVVGIQFHQVTAIINGLESLPSNEITVTNLTSFPLPRPNGLRRAGN